MEKFGRGGLAAKRVVEKFGEEKGDGRLLRVERNAGIGRMES